MYDPADLAVDVDGAVATLTWTASPNAVNYRVFRRSPQTGLPFDPNIDLQVGATDQLVYIDSGLLNGTYDWQVYAVSYGPPPNALLAETGDELSTESGDMLFIEGA